jgi:hypothetical protein
LDSAKDDLFNISKSASYPTGGPRKPLSAEARAKISAARKGVKLSPEHRAKLSLSKSGEKHPNFGKHLPMETRQKISAAQKGRRPSPEIVAKRVQAQTYAPLSLEHKAKISAALSGRERSPEHRENLSRVQRGRSHTSAHAVAGAVARWGDLYVPNDQVLEMIRLHDEQGLKPKAISLIFDMSYVRTWRLINKRGKRLTDLVLRSKERAKP